MRFAKGHGTGNDFLVLPDPDDHLTLSPELVTRLCDRRTGLGADGILRAVRTAAGAQVAVPAGPQLAPGHPQLAPGHPQLAPGHPQLAPGHPQSAPGHPRPTPGSAPEWFMDYRNADGTVAEMCGNGIRVFARYLLDHGLTAGPVIAVATRAGVRHVRVAADGEFTVDMGAVRILGASSAVLGGRACEGLAVSVGNPHLACLVDAPVASFDLSRPPVLDQRRFPDGANVEVVRVRGDGELEMRVHERGSGITLSCGTGAVAAAVAAAVMAAGGAAGVMAAGGAAVVMAGGAAGSMAAGGDAGGEHVSLAGTWTVHVPGGRLVVTLGEGTSLLSGPAAIVAEGELTDAWLSDAADGPWPAGKRIR
jgi:diaminopimelate epimerase